MKKLFLASIAALSLATGTVHAYLKERCAIAYPDNKADYERCLAEPTILDGIYNLEIPPGFAESSPPPEYPNLCICMREVFFVTYCVADIDKIPKTCFVTDVQTIKPAIVEISRSGDPLYIVIRQGQHTIGNADAIRKMFKPKD